jgi:fructokinase
MPRLFGGIEAGGTKFVCMVAAGPDQIAAETRFFTTSPEETLQHIDEFFKPFIKRGELASVGIGSFGPLVLNPASPNYGFITKTPKPGWNNTDLLGSIQKLLKLPVCLDTDVNAAAYGEYYWMSDTKDIDPLLYITVGTGIGVGSVVNGHPVHGLVHTEGGHILIPHDKNEDPFDGICPYHRDCWEGLASGPAMAKRWGKPADTLEDDHPGWDLEAKYIALAITNQILLYSPMRIVLGGGVSQHPGLIEKVRQQVQILLNGYVQSDMILNRIDEFIVNPGLGQRSGVLGAIALAIEFSK